MFFNHFNLLHRIMFNPMYDNLNQLQFRLNELKILKSIYHYMCSLKFKSKYDVLFDVIEISSNF